MLFKKVLPIVCTGILFAGVFSLPAYAKSSDEIQEELDEYEAQLEESEEEGGQLAEEIETCQNEVASLIQQIEQQNIQMESYRQAMMLRIKYFYEESPSDSLVDALLGAESFSDLLNRLDYVQNLYDYDSDQLDAFAALIADAEEKQAQLDEKTEELTALLDEEEALQAELKDKISDKEEELEEAKAAEEAAARARAFLAGSSGGYDGTYVSNAENYYDIDYSDGKLNNVNGVVYYGGHRETWYTQKLLPGEGLYVPGRYVASDGTVRDGDGYIVLASSDLSKGTVVETTLGAGKVYDSGCAAGTVDLYTDW